MDQLTLSKMFMKLGDLPSLPQVTHELVRLTEDPRANSADVSRIICQDQVLASKVLKLVNSAYYGLHRRVATVSEAVTLLGMKTLRTLVLGASVHKTLSTLKGKRAVNPEKIWRHSYACAVSSKLLAHKMGVVETEQAFIAGLLHDIGKIVFNFFLPDEYAKAFKFASMKQCSLYQAEKEVLNLTHTEIGKLVAEKWNLPPSLVDSIGLHHSPLTQCENIDLVQIVYLGSILAVMAGYSETGNNSIMLDNKVMEKWKLTYEMLHNMAEEIKSNISVDFL
ncbi:HDOD domain-containing protein [Phosphitispora sp. TUW77]|uniref:HDOD domain-containing protein n=1 Tax=Phosphitispora sp. TUW77 TaxID=3152361 RepID=UPI003AB476A3